MAIADNRNLDTRSVISQYVVFSTVTSRIELLSNDSTTDTKSGLATPFLIESAQADFVCVAAISIAVAKGGNKADLV